MKKQKGFSLIELLIVVAIILIIAAIAIPNLVRSRMAANEASAIGSMRVINTSCVAYAASYGTFPAALTNLGPIASGGTASSTSADLIDAVLSAGTRAATPSAIRRATAIRLTRLLRRPLSSDRPDSVCSSAICQA